VLPLGADRFHLDQPDALEPFVLSDVSVPLAARETHEIAVCVPARSDVPIGCQQTLPEWLRFVEDLENLAFQAAQVRVDPDGDDPGPDLLRLRRLR
jgi:hypothetical protein